MANDLNSGVLRPGAFSLSQSGGLEYGSREMTFDGQDKFYFAKGDTINDDIQTGVGVFVLSLQNRDIEELKGVAQTLCDKDIQTGGPETYDPPARFNVVCLEEGKAVARDGSLRLIPEKFREAVFNAPLRLSDQAWSEGKKLVKLDFTTISVEHKSTHYVVSVRFINSGDEWIKFKTPDQWSGNTTGGGLGVAPFSKIGKMNPRDDWGFALAGKKLINRNDFQDGEIHLNPGDSKMLKFEAIPDNKIAKGEYDFSGVAFMRIACEGNFWNQQTQVDFRPIKTRITVDRDYPSTPQEREQWEKNHRAEMSYFPIKPGATFAEDGLYRAVRTSGTSRSLMLKPFKAGEVATTDDVRMYTEAASGTELNGQVQWVWEASPPTPVKQWSFDLIDGTQQFCEPGVACPRSGRWVPRVTVGDSMTSQETRYQLAKMVTLRRGEPMPAIDGTYPHWEWVGAAHG
ncbi:MAG TPA: hypothetical protein VF534_15435 [Paraburkholderia sp.]